MKHQRKTAPLATDGIPAWVGAIVLVAVVLVVGWLLWPKQRLTKPATWFYDLNTGYVYRVPANSVPPLPAPSGPLAGVAGELPAGVEVVHFPTRGEEVPTIAFLRTMTPQAAEAMRSSLRTKEKLSPTELVAQMEQVDAGTLVKRIEGTTWEPAASPAGRAIIGSYLTMPGVPGKLPK
jgi:hypothetical protein